MGGLVVGQNPRTLPLPAGLEPLWRPIPTLGGDSIPLLVATQSHFLWQEVLLVRKGDALEGATGGRQLDCT